MRSIPTAPSLLGFLMLLGGCASSTAFEQSQAAERRGDWQRAFTVLHQEYVAQAAEGAVSDELEREHERVKREAMRDRAQALIFREREDDALALLDKLEALAPGFHGVDELRDDAKYKKAKALAATGDRLLAEREYQRAMEKFLESERVYEGNGLAAEGMEKVKGELARMDAVAQRQFLQAVRKYPEFRHVEVAWHADAVIRNSPDLEDERRLNAQRLRAQARTERARATFDEAEACAQLDKYGAALVLYRQVLELDPNFEGAEAAVEKMNSELTVLGLIESAQLVMRNGDFVKARGLLDQAFEQSELSRGAISELMIEARRLEAQAEYRAARDFEVMGKKAEALAAFEALATKWPDGFVADGARIEALRVDITGAQTEWQAALDAESAGDLEKALDHFINSARFYESWRDARAQIERLEKAIAGPSGEVESEAGGEGGN
ncbi:MAG: hypothetical protein VXY92_06385 [Planctomycetota bacterium]|nr:hypothetical protein [Planctomycetota bacterium]